MILYRYYKNVYKYTYVSELLKISISIHSHQNKFNSVRNIEISTYFSANTLNHSTIIQINTQKHEILKKIVTQSCKTTISQHCYFATVTVAVFRDSHQVLLRTNKNLIILNKFLILI